MVGWLAAPLVVEMVVEMVERKVAVRADWSAVLSADR
jgi:hypothetical protein